MAVVGTVVKRIDAEAKVKGSALYPGDVNLPEQLYMKVLFSGKAHAVIKSIDISEAQQVAGVVLILTAKDVPINEYGLGTMDQPVLCGPGSSKPFADHVRFEGDNIALIIAESDEIAAVARKKINITYEDLPIVTDVHKALEPDSILVHPDRNSNEFCHFKIRKGNIEEGFASAAAIIEEDYYTPIQEHAYLQPEAGIAYYDDEDRVTLIVAGQWVHEDQEQVAHALGLEKEQVRIIYPAIGGAFGGREDMSVQIILGLAIYKLRELGILRPVKTIWTREESIIGHHKRHPYHIHSKVGADSQGNLLAASVDIYADGGAYVYTSPKVLGNATLLCTGPYKIPNVRVDSRAVYTNNIPNGAFRGFGGPQAAYSIESQMDKLAEKLGMDPVELRMRNLLGEGDLLSVGTPLPKGVSIKQVTEKCALSAGWTHDDGGWHRPIVHSANEQFKLGWGISCGFKNIGFSFGAPEHCFATIELYGQDQIDRAVLKHAGADVGQGSHTAFVQMAAEALGLPMDKVELIASDTASSLNSGSVSASRMTFMAGNAIRGAAREALVKWQSEERPACATYKYIPPKTTPYDPETGKAEPNFAYGYVAEAVLSQVDVETGEVALKKVICANDVGQAINPQQVEGQIEGAVVQAAGYSILENYIQKNGHTFTSKLSTYLIPTVLDIPDEVESVILEYPDPIGPWGARGMGEMPYLPFVPAFTSSVHDAIGIWFNEFPLTAERVSNALDTKKDSGE
ncbi:putative xanthine dehydrogenase subunit D [bioreactor metagenome]|uniref:Putative xanthine dehydrogenase subunit D n=1 Tax=bioreactor metagenome TaxID=1076179 RepID=A0A644YNG1_9ZZZZ